MSGPELPPEAWPRAIGGLAVLCLYFGFLGFAFWVGVQIARANGPG